MKLDKKQKQIAIAVAAAVALWLAYSWYKSRQTAATTSTASDTSGTPVDTTSSDYAALAGQEQGDVAALQNQNSQLYSQEQSDVGALTTTLANITSGLDAITTNMNTTGSSIAAIASGEQAINRRETAMHKVNPDSAFARYYKKVTGKSAPAQIAVTNFVYQAYKNGIKAAALTPPTSHPSSNNTHVAHPNGGHTGQTGHHTNTGGGKTTKPAGNPKTSGTRK